MKLIAATAIVFAAAVEAAPIRKRNVVQHRSLNNDGKRQVEEKYNPYLGIEGRRLEGHENSMSMPHNDTETPGHNDTETPEQNDTETPEEVPSSAAIAGTSAALLAAFGTMLL